MLITAKWLFGFVRFDPHTLLNQQRDNRRNMTKITQINDRSAATAWSPVAEYAGVIALGAKVRNEDDNDNE